MRFSSSPHAVVASNFSKTIDKTEPPPAAAVPEQAPPAAAVPVEAPPAAAVPVEAPPTAAVPEAAPPAAAVPEEAPPEGEPEDGELSPEDVPLSAEETALLKLLGDCTHAWNVLDKKPHALKLGRQALERIKGPGIRPRMVAEVRKASGRGQKGSDRRYRSCRDPHKTVMYSISGVLNAIFRCTSLII